MQMVTSDETQIQIFADWPIESLSNDDDDAEDDAKQKWNYILPAKFAIVSICSLRQWLWKRAQAKYTMISK